MAIARALQRTHSASLPDEIELTPRPRAGGVRVVATALGSFGPTVRGVRETPSVRSDLLKPNRRRLVCLVPEPACRIDLPFANGGFSFGLRG